MLKLGIIYRDGLVLQQGKKMKITGIFTPKIARQVTIKAALKSGTKIVSEGSVAVELSQEEESAPFTVALSELSKGGPFTLEICELNHPSTLITLNDVYVGEVWLAGGQDNVILPLNATSNIEEEIADFKDRKIRCFKVPTIDDNTSEKDSEGEWTKIGKKTVGNMSALSYYFIKALRTKLTANTMIGIVECAEEDSSILTWMSEENIRSTVDGKIAYDAYKKEYLANKKESDSVINDNLDQVNKVLIKPCALFDNKLLNIKSFCFRGVIFYQGESDCDVRCKQYATLFKGMIGEWRSVFEDDKLPFIFAQLPMYISKSRRFLGFDDLHWPILRANQEQVANVVTNTYMAILTDCGEFDNIKPVDKQTPGNRMGMLALKHIYGNYDVSADAPRVTEIVRSGDKIELRFVGDFTNLNCVCAEAAESGFEIAGRDDEFHPAMASIDFDGRTVILDCPKVEFATKVRYAYFSYGNAPLVTNTGLAVRPINETIEKGLGSELYQNK